MGGAMRTPRVGIIGAGMSGIGMAAKLRMAGIDSFHLYEQWDDLGGTWHANTYPGLYCDIASRYYQYTFFPNPDWTHVYSPQREIRAYLSRVAEHFRVREQTSLRTRVEEVEWVDDEWRLRTQDGREAAYDFIVTAAGGLVHTRKPDLPGLGSFAGATFHSAEWDHSVALDGRRIAVIGTGSTGIQITRALARRAGHFELYQRTPQWIFPLPNRRYTRLASWMYRRFPALNGVAYRFWQAAFEGTFGTATVRPGFWRWVMSTGCRLHVRRVRDPELRRRFTPRDAPMCKRLVMGTGFYKLFERPNVDLVDAAIDHVEARGIVTADGELHELDVIVLATGFDAHAFVRPTELIGPGGLRLSEVWNGEPYAYRSVALPGFPNVLMLIGPHSPFGNQSLFTISETQMDFAMGMIERWRRGELDTVAPTREATDRFNAAVRAALPNTVWATGCKSWYLGKDGLPHAWPWTPKRHREILAEPEWSDWEVGQRTPMRSTTNTSVSSGPMTPPAPRLP
jgi:cation diffusion facilitator CzcD-associated flavoprotein CzcO